MINLLCIGSPYALGERLAPGTEVDQMRASGIVAEWDADWIDITPDFDAVADPIVAVNRALAETIRAYPDRFPVIFAGDCLSSLGAVKGLVDITGAQPGVIWYDAHGDFNTPETSPGGFLGGMPLAMLVGRGDLSHPQAIGLEPLDERHVLLTDARDLDPGEAATLRASAVTHLTSVNDLLTAPLPDGPLYVHLDMDVLRMDDMPATRFPTQGGPTLAEAAATITRLARDGQVAGLLLGLWNSDLATDDRPLNSTLTMVRAFVDGLRA